MSKKIPSQSFQSLLATRPVLITGSSSGIGYYIAHQLKQRGYPVFASVRQKKDVKRLQQQGLNSLVLDLADSVSIETAVTSLLEQTNGRIYGLFNNGAYAQIGAVEDISRTVICQQFETNLFGGHELTCQLLPIMRQQKQGRIIQNSSLSGLMALPYLGAYNASKFALEGLTDTLRMELAGSGVFISLLEPLGIASQALNNAQPLLAKNIKIEHSVHQKQYQKIQQQLSLDRQQNFQSPKIVLKRVIDALEAKHPQARYYIHSNTYVLSTLKRLLPTSIMDWILKRLSFA